MKTIILCLYATFLGSNALLCPVFANEEKHKCAEAIHKLLNGARFLHKHDPTLQQSRPIKRASLAAPELHQPEDQIAYWLTKIEGRLQSADPAIKEHQQEVIRRFYQQNYIIKAQDVPESYFDAQKRIAREQGHGAVIITESQRKEMITTLQADQRGSLDDWLDYLLSEDADVYPIWAKYWCFEGMLKLGNFNEATGKFTRRTKSTAAPFAELNREAFANVVDALIKKTDGKPLTNLNDEDFITMVKNGASFNKLYGRQLKLAKENMQELNSTEGKWVKFDKGTSGEKLAETLNGQGTGWCTASAGGHTADKQLAAGDFYVYYTKDQQGNMTKPRLAIRMDNQSIAEVRGIGPDQNLDSQIAKTDILENKLKEFGVEGERYKKRAHNMKRLTEIDQKNNNGIALTKDELSFLYEVKFQIEGFGHKKDPRIKEILSTRDHRKDLSLATGFKESEISLTQEEALSGQFKFHYGELELGYMSYEEGLILPKYVLGDVIFPNLLNATNIQFPKSITGDLKLRNLETAKGLTLPENIGGNLILYSLRSPQGLVLPKSIGGDLSMIRLASADGLVFPKQLYGELDLQELSSHKGLQLPDEIRGNLILNTLSSADGLKLPQKLGGTLSLNGLRTAQGLILPKHVMGNLNLNGLISAKGLILPKYVKNRLSLNGLVSAKGLILPDRLEGELSLAGLKSAEGLNIPADYAGTLDLNSLTSAKDLILPEKLQMLYLNSLKSAEDLVLPDSLKLIRLNSLTSTQGLVLPKEIETISFRSLTSAEGLEFPEVLKGGLFLEGLVSAKGLKLPRKIGKTLDLASIISPEGLILPESVGGLINLKSLRSAKDLVLPQEIGMHIWFGSLPANDGMIIPVELAPDKIRYAGKI